MSLELEVGELKGRMSGIEKRMDSLETKVDSVEEKVDKLLSLASEAKGGWKVVSIVALVASTGGAIIGKAITLLAK